MWIYGGSETAGGISDPLYNGCNLAAAGTIVVSVAYRLGPLGWLALANAGIQGNFGIQDILLGLQWVQSNIASFGGDPVRLPVILAIGKGQASQCVLMWVLCTEKGPALWAIRGLG